MYGEDRESNHGLETSLLEEAEENNTVSISCALSPVNTINPEDGNDLKPHHEGLGEHDTQSVTGSHRANDLLDNETDDLLLEIDKQSPSDPVEILRFLQRQLIKGYITRYIYSLFKGKGSLCLFCKVCASRSQCKKTSIELTFKTNF